jgi:hypothetical protein
MMSNEVSCLKGARKAAATEYLIFDWKNSAYWDHKIRRHAGFARLDSHLHTVTKQSSSYLVHHNNCAIGQGTSLSRQVRSGSKVKRQGY